MLGTATASQHNINFYMIKLTSVFLVLLTRLEVGSLMSYVTFPPQMSHMATRSLFGYSNFPKGGAVYRIWLFNGISFSSLFYIKKIQLLHTQKVYVSLVSV